MSWQQLKSLIQTMDERRAGSKKGEAFEKLVVQLLESVLKIPFVRAKTGSQPSGDARSVNGKVAVQVKNYSKSGNLDAERIVRDILRVEKELEDLQIYVLTVSCEASQLYDELVNVEKKTGLDIVVLELTDKLSDLGALCVTYWRDLQNFQEFSETCENQKLLDWMEKEKQDPKTTEKIKKVKLKLEHGIQTQNQVQKDTEKYLRERFSTGEGFNPINLSQAIERESLEAQISDWWTRKDSTPSVCCLEGEEGIGKTWLAAKTVNAICRDENIVTFWLDSKNWKSCKDLSDMLQTCLRLIYPPTDEKKVSKLQDKIVGVWQERTLIVLDGVNERNAIEAAQGILDEYFRHENKWKDQIRILLTTRPLHNYPAFENALWNKCHPIAVETFDDNELMTALTRGGLQLGDLPPRLVNTARIPRYFQRCIELREELGSFDVVTKGMVLLTDLLDKIKHSDPQIRETLGWSRTEDPKEFFSHLAQQMNWDKIDDAPEKLGQSVKNCFSNYSKIRQDLEEQHIVRKAGLFNVELSDDYVLLCWALYLSNLFDCTEFTGIKGFAQDFQNVLEPISAEDLRTEALFLALQISAISPDPDISQDQLSQKRAALMLAWSNSHNASVTDDRLSYWTEKDPDAYAQVVEFEFENHNVPKYEEMLIEPLARAWLNKKGQTDRLASRLKEWLLPDDSVNSPENREYTDVSGSQVLLQRYDPQVQLSAAALSILSQRPEPQFLETLAHCHAILERYESPDKNIGVLMRWGYTEDVLDDLHLLAKQTQDDKLLSGIRGLASSLRLVELPLLLQYPVSEKNKERHAFVEQWNRTFKPYIDRIRDQEKLLVGDSPADNVQGNYHRLDYLAVRTDLPSLTEHDKVEIKKVLHHISTNAKLGWGVGATLESFCIENLMPWVAKYDPESYTELACSIKLNTLNQKWAQFKLSSIQALIFKSNSRRKITEEILRMKERLTRGKDFYPDIEWLTSLLTESLLFSASEKVLTNWFEFLASHEPLRISICRKSQRSLLEELLPGSIVRMAQQKLESLQSSSFDNQDLSGNESKEFSEDEFWFTLYAYGIRNNKNTVKWALEDLKIRKPDSTRALPILRLALCDSNQFLTEALTDEKIREHLLSKHGKKFIPPIYDSEDNVPAYDTLRSLLPIEIVGSFLCVPNRQDDLSRWGRELMEWLCSILQGAEGDSNSVRELRYTFNQEVLEIWAEQNEADFLQLTEEYLTRFFKSPRYRQALRDFTDTILCLLLRFRPIIARQYYHQWNAEGFSRIIYRTSYGVETFLAQLWQVEDCNLSKHRHLRRKLLEECLNDEDIMFMTLAALAGGGEDELWNLVTQKYLESPYAKERNLGVSILPWFGKNKAVGKLEQLISEDSNRWVREHAAWAYEVAQQERSCREVYQKALQTRDLFRISAVFEQMKPALSPTARWWHREIDEKEFSEELQDSNPKLLALLHRFWYRWGNSSKVERNIEVFGRKLREYCRGEKLPAIQVPRIAPWWKPTSNSEN